jgi:hypothetical protein
MRQMPLPFEPREQSLFGTPRIPRGLVRRDAPVRDKRLTDDHLAREAMKAAIAVIEVRRVQLARAEQLLQRLVQHV